MNLENVWIPATPGKPVVEMQQSEKGGENWDDLLGIYSGVLQDQNCIEPPPQCSFNSLVDLTRMELTTRDFHPAYNQNVAFAETYNTLLPWDKEWTHLAGLNHRGNNGIFNQNALSYASYLQNNPYSLVPHQNIDSIAELLGKPTSSIGLYSQVERSYGGTMDRTMHLQNRILNANQDYNMQQIPTSRLSVTYRPSYNYNLNLPPRIEAGQSSRPHQLEPATPGQQKLLQNSKIHQVPHLTIKENSKQDNAVLHHQAEIGEREHTNFVDGSPSASSAVTSETPLEKQISDERNDEEIDLNKTPLQKTPKRRKHRPKVVKEGKPKGTPKPKATPNNTNGGNSTTKRKYVRKKGIKTSMDQSSDATNVAEVSNSEDREKSCKRALNFDLENGGKKIKGGEFDNQADNVGGSKSNLNLNFHNAELNWQSTSSENVLHQNLNNFIHSVYKAPPQESLPVAATAPPASLKDRTLNVIARSLSMRNANINQSGNQTTNGQVHHHIDGGLAQILAYTTAKDCSEQIQSTGNKSFHAESSKLPLHRSPYFSSEGKSTFIDLTDETDMVTHQWCMNSTDSGHKIPKQVNSYASHHLAKAQTTVANCNMVFVSQRDSQVTKGNKIKYGQAARQTPSSIVSKNLQGLGHVSKKVAGSHEYKRNISSIEHLIDRMKHLYIGTNNGKKVVEEEQIAKGALVPYRGDGAVVPFKAFEPIQKRRPRPKVDLDPETNRLWNLLMGNEASEGAETVNNDKQKFWEEERKVFRGRVDSFIARMHLVQGDRRFSKWKGSVVDSVIGVFLTQNVSDHLSSSAFMSLAAKFPAKSTTIRETCGQSRGNLSTEHEVIISFPDEKTSCHQPQSQYKEETLAENNLVSNPTTRREEDVISSQSSSEYMTFQASEDFRSSSGSNSEAEDQVTRSSSRKIHDLLNLYEQDERKQYQVQETGSPSTNYWQKMLVGLDEKEEDLLEFLGKECTSSLTSTHLHTTNGTSLEHADDIAGQNAESNITDQLSRSSNFVKMNLPTESQSRNSQHFINYSQGDTKKTFQQESSILTNPTKSAESFKQKSSGNQNPSENITLEPSEMKASHVSDEQSSKISKASNVRKRKAEKEKVEPFNWDTLRKQVPSEAGTKERSKNTLDTLDYEALQNASVHEISQTIKERGMNNMLAARMKDFLNRLVKDHGSVDLEWLRDVQPDKAKDYLLSMRGLGLKSVECVRLLTLHHLAFPVDTNVGRIAVRLGWVPLQPLPETLQLHLLELYPVLETIQKYLWPRLCMLDQETLYELHYQLITFGKVFCTKRQPNCNACPMRGECRHFASAFASARLALPGPEERRIVCSDVPSCSSKSCGGVMHPMPLPPAESNLGRRPAISGNCGGVMHPMPLPPAEGNLGTGPAITGNCEPIIEEPTTPEYSIEESERDIEDAFYEDPDEIPEIKLNIEEFTTNLQSFIQENMEMQEGDMSNALVALSPGFASIPTPKLKHVSRLRTEHRVYELPDSHPLLKGMDRREPDDPSPYLLAIWAPGETADSVQPPVSECSSSKGGLCNMKTCFSCNSTRETQAQTVRGTILIPCRTAMRGSFPLNGTYFQVNEVFADDETSMNPIDVPRSLIWNLSRRTVFFGTSVSTIFKGMSTEDIQYCFWKGFVCVRGFNQKTRAPRPLKARLHLVASKMAKKKE